MKKLRIIAIFLAATVAIFVAINFPSIFNRSLFSRSQIASFDRGQKYKVIKVFDGDTIEANINNHTEKVRFIGIDTPETSDPRKVVQCFGREASDKAKQLLENKNIYFYCIAVKNFDNFIFLPSIKRS
ncbi:MAG: thermonuclease family protein [bacterium]|nr:thermonuclease family protein [bacterium]